MEDELHQRAAALLDVIWRGIPAAYKSRYRRNIWQQFEDNVRSAAYTSNLGKFVNSLCQNLSVAIYGADDIELANDALREGSDKTLLKLMREETTLLVLMVRLRNQERREEWKAKRAESKTEEESAMQPGLGLPIEKEEEVEDADANL